MVGFLLRSVNQSRKYQKDVFCTVSLSLFAGPGQILRRFSVFAEEPRKSIITVTEPCNPVFKEAQPRPSKLSSEQISLI